MEILNGLALGLGWVVILIGLLALVFAWLTGVVWCFAKGKESAWGWMVAARLMRKYQTDQKAVNDAMLRGYSRTKWDGNGPEFDHVLTCLKNASAELDKRPNGES